MHPTAFLIPLAFVLATDDPDRTAEQAAALKSLREATADQMTFFRAPSERAFAKIRDGIEENADASGLKDANVLPSVAFLAAAAEKHGYAVPGESRSLVAARAVLEGEESNPWTAFILDDSLTPSRMDVWWNRYFATGDEENIRRVLRQINPELERPQPKDGRPPSREELMPWALSETAKWSFNSIGKKLPEVAGFAVFAVEEPEFEAIKPFLLASLAGKKISARAREELRRRGD